MNPHTLLAVISFHLNEPLLSVLSTPKRGRIFVFKNSGGPVNATAVCLNAVYV